MKGPRLRDSNNLITRELYPLGQIPDEVIKRVGAYFVYLLATGRKDLSGDDWGDAFAYAINGTHLKSPVGIADFVYEDKQAWSMKTVKKTNPFRRGQIRLISGRCSPDYSYGIANPHDDLQATGRAVLGIWNERINIARDHYNPVRTVVLVRSEDMSSFCIYEEDNQRYSTNEYVWKENSKNNLVGMKGEQTCFTWQPHGSQFTIHSEIPENAIKFKIRKPDTISQEKIWETVGFSEDWVQIIK